MKWKTTVMPPHRGGVMTTLDKGILESDTARGFLISMQITHGDLMLTVGCDGVILEGELLTFENNIYEITGVWATNRDDYIVYDLEAVAI